MNEQKNKGLQDQIAEIQKRRMLMKVVEQKFRKAVGRQCALDPVSWGHAGLHPGKPGLLQGEDREGKGEKVVP